MEPGIEASAGPTSGTSGDQPPKHRRSAVRPGELKAWRWWFEEEARPAWHEQAACRGRTDQFFQDGRGAEAQAVRQAALDLCAGCPVRTECFAYADAAEVRHGIWGGELMTFWLMRARRRATGEAS